MQNEAERLEIVISCVANGNAAEFSRITGINKGQVSQMLSGAIKIGESRGGKILKAYPQVQREWLLRGTGYAGDLSLDMVKAHYEEIIRQDRETIQNLSESLLTLIRKSGQ